MAKCTVQMRYFIQATTETVASMKKVLKRILRVSKRQGSKHPPGLHNTKGWRVMVRSPFALSLFPEYKAVDVLTVTDFPKHKVQNEVSFLTLL